MKVTLLAGLVLTATLTALAQGVWVNYYGTVQFGVTAVVGGVAEQSPAVIGSARGAFVFGDPTYFWGAGQTFTVPSLRTLQSVELRVGRFNNTPSTGQFEVAIYDGGTKLAGVLANADYYWQFSLQDPPVSSFSFAGLGVLLSPTKTYFLSVEPTSTYAGGLLTLAGFDRPYSGGSAYELVVPEPSAVALWVLGLVCLGVVRTRHGRAQSPRCASGAPTRDNLRPDGPQRIS